MGSFTSLLEDARVRVLDAALAARMVISPASKQLRVRRRRLPIMRLKRTDLEQIGRLVAPGAEILDAAPVSAGFSPATQSLTRISYSAAGEVFHVIAKEYYVPAHAGPEWLPREVEILRRAASHLSGKCFRYPRFFGVTRGSSGRPIAVSEMVQPSDAHPGARPFALGEFAASPLPPSLREYLKTSKHHSHGPLDSARDRLSELLGEQDTANIMASYRECVELVQQNNVPLMLAHGDAQSPNLPAGDNGRIIILDSGNMRLAPVGYDLGRMLDGSIRQHSREKFARVQAATIRHFIQGLNEQGAAVDEHCVRVGYASGVLYLLQIAARRSDSSSPRWAKIMRRYAAAAREALA